MFALFHNVHSCAVGQIEIFGGHIQAPQALWLLLTHLVGGSETKNKTQEPNKYQNTTGNEQNAWNKTAENMKNKTHPQTNRLCNITRKQSNNEIVKKQQ